MRKLIQKLAEVIYLKFARLRHQEEVIDVRDYLSQILTALILAPSRMHEAEQAGGYLDDLQQCFPETQFYLLGDRDFAKTVVPNDNLQLMPYEPTQINIYGLPKKEVSDLVRARRFDLVIDLNQEFCLFSTAICRASQTKLRVCLQHPKRDSFYNFQVRPAHGNGLRYESLIRYLSAFKSLPEAPSRDLLPV